MTKEDAQKKLRKWLDETGTDATGVLASNVPAKEDAVTSAAEGTRCTADLVPSVSVDAFVAKRDAAVDHIRAAHVALREANDMIRAMSGSDEHYNPACISLQDRTTHRYFEEDDGAERAIAKLDARLWDWLLHRSGLWSLMDASSRAEWDSATRGDRPVPEMTRSNIEATFSHLHAGRREMFERGVVNLFRSLSWDYKTNRPVRFGRRLVLTQVVDAWGGKGRWEWSRIAHDAGNKIDDLERALCVLDGKPEPDHRSSAQARLRDQQWPGAGENPAALSYFSIRGFKNGNAHLTFTRQDLVDEMNRIIAKHHPEALPPATHFDEGSP